MNQSRGSTTPTVGTFFRFLPYQVAQHIPEGQTIASGGESRVRTSAAPAICCTLSVPVVAGVAEGAWLRFPSPPTSYWQATQHNKLHTYIKCLLLPRRTAGAAVGPRDTNTRLRRGRMLMGWTNLRTRCFFVSFYFIFFFTFFFVDKRVRRGRMAVGWTDALHFIVSYFNILLFFSLSLISSLITWRSEEINCSYFYLLFFLSFLLLVNE